MKYFKKIIDTLYQNNINHEIDEALSAHTSIRIGGKCKVFVNVKTEKELIFVVRFLQKIKVKFYLTEKNTCDNI